MSVRVFIYLWSKEAMLEMLNDGGVVAVCGSISQYDTRPEKRLGVRNLFQAVAKRLRIEGGNSLNHRGVPWFTWKMGIHKI